MSAAIAHARVASPAGIAVRLFFRGRSRFVKTQS